MRKSIVFILLFSMMFTSCTTISYPIYDSKAKGINYGYSDTQLQQDVYRITYQGIYRMPQKEVLDMVLLRAAEVTLNNGFSYFAVIGPNSEQYVYDQYDTGIDYFVQSSTIKCFEFENEATPTLFLYNASSLRDNLYSYYNYKYTETKVNPFTVMVGMIIFSIIFYTICTSEYERNMRKYQ
ncbi:MAG: hypothetical protein FWD54_01580 [Endomicrobia bacterium]|nr:hypothetical protein [Endomicrobiia bacterium]